MGKRKRNGFPKAPAEDEVQVPVRLSRREADMLRHISAWFQRPQREQIRLALAISVAEGMLVLAHDPEFLRELKRDRPDLDEAQFKAGVYRDLDELKARAYSRGTRALDEVPIVAKDRG